MRVIGSLADPDTGDTEAPTIPTGLSGTAINKNRVDLTWNASTDNVGVSGYQIFRDGSPIDTTASTSYTDNTVIPSTQYSYTVLAFDAAGNNSAQSGAELVTTPANAAPSWSAVPDQNLIVGNAYNLNLADFTNDGDTDPLTYSIQLGTLPTGLSLTTSTVSGTPTTAGQSQAVTFRVDDGNDFADQIVQFDTFDADVTAPPVPQNLQSTAQTTSTVDLSWSASTDVAGSANEFVSGTASYRLYRDSGLVVDQAGLTFQDTGRSANTQYSYTISSVDAEGNESSQSNAVLVTTDPLASQAVLARDGVATPHQMALVVSNLTAWSQATTATCEYRTAGSGVYTTGHPLHRVNTTGPVTPPWAGGIEDVFAWTIFGLEPNTAYDVRVTLDDGATQQVLTLLNQTTKALPSEPGAVDRTISAGSTPAQIQTALDAALPGEHVQFENGTYDMTGVGLPPSLSGSTETTPTYLTGETRSGVILQRLSNNPILRFSGNTSNLVIQDLTLQGVGTDGTPGLEGSTGVYSPGSGSVENLTVRRVTATGVHRGVYLRGANAAVADQRGVMVYNCRFVGNNTWNETLIRGSAAWDDYGILMAGDGHAVFNCYLQGFGDVFSTTSGSSGSRSYQDKNQHFYWNDVNIGLDDLMETDDGYRNITCYQSRARNVVNAGSQDPLYGGPYICWGMLFINVLETRMFKWNDDSAGSFHYSNTFAMTDKIYRSSPGQDNIAMWYQPSGLTQYNVGFANNVLSMLNGGPTTRILWNDSFWSGDADIHHNSWFPDGSFSLGAIDEASLAAFQAAQPAADGIFRNFQRFESDSILSSAQPWVTTISLGATALVESTDDYRHQDFELSSPQNTGFSIPGITDNLTESFTGAAPDRGAKVRGLTYPTVGDTSSPAYADGMVAYDVRQLTGTYSPVTETMESVTPAEWLSNASPSGEDAQAGRTVAGVLSSWSGGAGATVDTVLDGFLVVHGGGHNDSGNNGMYLFDPQLSGNVAVGWESPVDISAQADAVQNVTAYSDGRPTSVHSYEGLVWAPDRRRFYRFGGSSFDGPGDFVPSLWEYNPAEAVESRWTQLLDYPGGVSSSTPMMFYDQAAGKLIAMHPGINCHIYDIDAGTWSSALNITLEGSFDFSGSYDPTRNRIIGRSGNSGGVRTWEFNLTTDSEASSASVTFTGDTGLVTNGEPAFAYDPTLDVFWVIGGSSTAFYNRIAWFSAATLASTPGAVPVTEVTFNSAANIATTGFEDGMQGTYGRYLLIDQDRLLLTVHRLDEGVWLVKLPSSL